MKCYWECAERSPASARLNKFSVRQLACYFGRQVFDEVEFRANGCVTQVARSAHAPVAHNAPTDTRVN